MNRISLVNRKIVRWSSMSTLNDFIRARTSRVASVEALTYQNMTPLKVSSEQIQLEYKLNTELDLNPMGNMHGGRMAYILDSVMSALASDFDKTDVNSLNFSVSYLNGISKDLDSFLVTAKIVKGGRAMAFLTAELSSKAGEIYTLSEGSFAKCA
ncbi:unnamed protein product [Oikopleura dioica]|uniref:Thioesterase domain-containing protein n=1 Tax=Oikopleura dioica TaxID=34765 RepID=E4YKH5_OIKDI|nr:unnamed protein product [Oikopleura dioica]